MAKQQKNHLHFESAYFGLSCRASGLSQRQVTGLLGKVLRSAATERCIVTHPGARFLTDSYLVEGEENLEEWVARRISVVLQPVHEHGERIFLVHKRTHGQLAQG